MKKWEAALVVVVVLFALFLLVQFFLYCGGSL